MNDYPYDLAAFAPPCSTRKPRICKRVFDDEVRGREVSRVSGMIAYFHARGVDVDLTRSGLVVLDRWFETAAPTTDSEGRLGGVWATWSIDLALAIGAVAQNELGETGEWRLFPAWKGVEMGCTPGLWIRGDDYPGQPIGWMVLKDVHAVAQNPGLSTRPAIVRKGLESLDAVFGPDCGGLAKSAAVSRVPMTADVAALDRYRAAIADGVCSLEGVVLLADTAPRDAQAAVATESGDRPNPKLIGFLDDFYRLWPDVPIGHDVEVPPPYEYNLYEAIVGNTLGVDLTRDAPLALADDLVALAKRRGLLVYDTVTGGLI